MTNAEARLFNKTAKLLNSWLIFLTKAEKTSRKQHSPGRFLKVI
jgi:hypothetical protein